MVVGCEVVTYLFRVTYIGASRVTMGMSRLGTDDEQKQHAYSALKPFQSVEQVFPDNRGGNPIYP
jgi:hypothetical protein